MEETLRTMRNKRSIGTNANFRGYKNILRELSYHIFMQFFKIYIGDDWQ